MSELLPDYTQMLVLLGRALHVLRTEYDQQAVLVGGAAVELHTGGRYATGDFDIHFPDAKLFSEVLDRYGFLKEKGVGRLLNRWYHPECLTYGVQIVSGYLYDGNSDRSRLQLIKIASDAEVIVPPVEDLIADRLGQYCSINNNPDKSSLEQAKLLVSLAEEIDWDYLRQRVVTEQGDLSLVEGIR